MKWASWFLVGLVVLALILLAMAGGGSSVLQHALSRASSSWPWYLTRGSGLVAAVLLVLLMLSGMGSITGHTFRFLEPVLAWATHRALGIALGVTVLIHVGSLLIDKVLPFSLVNVLVPFSSSYMRVKLWGIPVGSLYVALGIFAFYGLIIVVLSSLKWVDSRPTLWKLLHFTNYGVILAVFIHALNLGTDLASGWLRWVWWASAVVIAIMVAARARRSGTLTPREEITRG